VDVAGAGAQILAASGDDANAMAGNTNDKAANSNGTRRTGNLPEGIGRTLPLSSSMLTDPIVMLAFITGRVCGRRRFRGTDGNNDAMAASGQSMR